MIRIIKCTLIILLIFCSNSFSKRFLNFKPDINSTASVTPLILVGDIVGFTTLNGENNIAPSLVNKKVREYLVKVKVTKIIKGELPVFLYNKESQGEYVYLYRFAGKPSDTEYKYKEDCLFFLGFENHDFRGKTNFFVKTNKAIYHNLRISLFPTRENINKIYKTINTIPQLSIKLKKDKIKKDEGINIELTIKNTTGKDLYFSSSGLPGQRKFTNKMFYAQYNRIIQLQFHNLIPENKNEDEIIYLPVSGKYSFNFKSNEPLGSLEEGLYAVRGTVILFCQDIPFKSETYSWYIISKYIRLEVVD